MRLKLGRGLSVLKKWGQGDRVMKASQNIIIRTKSRRMTWAMLVGRMEEDVINTSETSSGANSTVSCSRNFPS